MGGIEDGALIAPVGEVSVAVNARDAFYLALANSGAALIKRIELANVSVDPAAHPELTVRVTLDAPTEGLFEPLEIVVPTPAMGDSFELRHFDLEPNLGRLAQVEEEMRGRIVATVLAGDSVVGSSVSPVEVMAYDQWLSRRDHFDSLAAFVLPNHPAVSTILSRASELLEQSTKDGSLQGYQAGPDRVDEIARAIFDAVKEKQLGYIDPPAGVMGIGQKIRTPGRVLEDGRGTCIDLAALFASCLAQAGIDPVIVLPPGHAMPAYFRHDRTPTGFAVTDDQNALDQMVRNEELVAFEGVSATSDDSFGDAVAKGAAQIAGVDAAVLIKDARFLGVRPLPHRRTEDDGTVVVVQDSSPPEFARPAVKADQPVRDPASDDDAERLEREDVPGRVQRWLSSLLDLTYSNPLLNMRVRAGKSGTTGALALGIPAQSLAQLEDRLSAGKPVSVRSPTAIPAPIRERGAQDNELAAYFDQQAAVYWPDATALEQVAQQVAHEAPPEVSGARREKAVAELAASVVDSLSSSALRNLRSRARVLEQQTGANNLFLAIGTLRWKDPKRPEPLRSPLFLWPVRLNGTRHGEFSIVLDDEAPVTPNYCLIEKLRDVHGLELADLEVPPLDESGIDLNGAIQAVRKSLSEAGVPGISVEETAHLAMFNFTSFRLWKDMKDHWPEFLENEVVSHLVHHPGEDFVASDTGDHGDKLEVLCPIPTDESQRAAVEAAVGGESFVLEGPPGTGKSQTIANLLACAIAAGKSVLFVAEKQTALTVVRNRMKEIGLDSFCLDLHDRGSTPAQIRAQLQSAMDFSATGSVDEWQRLDRRQAAQGERLQSYREAIHADGPAGLSAWAAWQRSLALGEGQMLEVSRDFVTRGVDDVVRVEELLLGLPAVAYAADLRVGHPWGLSDSDSYSTLDRERLASTISELARFLEDLEADDAAASMVDAIEGTVADELGTLARLLQHPVSLTTDSVRAAMEGHWEAHSSSTAQALAESGAKIETQLAANASEVVGAIDALEPLASELADAGFFGRRGARKRFVAALAEIDIETDDPAAWAAAVTSAASEIRSVRGHVAVWNDLAGLRLGSEWVPLSSADAQAAEEQRATVVAVGDLLRSGRVGPVVQMLDRDYPPPASVVDAWVGLARQWKDLGGQLGVTAPSEQRWLDGDSFGARLGAALSAWQLDADDIRFLQLQRWMTLVAHLEPLVPAGLEAARTAVLEGRVDPLEASDAFLRGLAVAARRERFEASGIDRFDAQTHDRLLAGYVSGETEKRELMRDYISHRLVERRPFEPGQRIGRFGRLESDLARTRGRLSVRALFETYGDIVPVLTPCFMMSPDSVARFLPPAKAHFDLVVFDEASQIEVAWAVGAIGRADSVVIVGDSQQMPPSRFGGPGVRDAEDSTVDDDVVEDLESILSECVESRLPRRWLSCHYRSRDESLIAFSNLEFYDRKLTTFPTPSSGGRLGLRWHRVNGVFDRSSKGDELRTNRVEAEAIVAEITRRVNDPASPNTSIVVVTLNVQQMRLVEELLAASSDDAVLAALADDSDDGLIVRNLESVQGDERDVVMLSVAFSANPATGKFPLNFGPLNQKGGERRLNVAITRAREEVLVFCSFEPEDLKLPDTIARGLRCLHDYLLVVRDGVERSGDLLARSVDTSDRHRSEIAEALRAEGLVVGEDLGLSDFRVDLAIRRPDDDAWRAAVLLDGPRWAQRERPEDRDVLPLVALTQAMNWPVVARVWLPAWIDEREAVIERLLEVVENPESALEVEPLDEAAPVSQQTDVAQMRSSLPSPPITRAESAPTRPTLESPISDFVAASLGGHGSMADFDAMLKFEQQSVVRELAAVVLASEGPARRGRLLRVVAAAYGFSRLRGAREEALAELLPDEMQRWAGQECFVWPADLDPAIWRSIRRTPPGSDRLITDVPPEEIVNVVGHFAEIGMGVTEDEAHNHLKELFEFRRLTENIAEVITAALNAGVANGALEYREEHFYVGPKW
ncbi:MAG: hypothetical protein ACI81L_003458 [Verrucomicrobiales bacterium]|jgi:hypothetical protein